MNATLPALAAYPLVLQLQQAEFKPSCRCDSDLLASATERQVATAVAAQRKETLPPSCSCLSYTYPTIIALLTLKTNTSLTEGIPENFNSSINNRASTCKHSTTRKWMIDLKFTHTQGVFRATHLSQLDNFIKRPMQWEGHAALGRHA